VRAPWICGCGQGPRRARVEHVLRVRQQRLLLVHAPELPAAEPGEQQHRRERQRPAEPPVASSAHAASPADCDNLGVAPCGCAEETALNDSLKTLLIVAFLILIVWNLGAGLYYMLVDKGQTKRTVNALTKRIALSVALIGLVILSIYMGWITPHGVGRAPVP
jgi:hypothetical protein